MHPCTNESMHTAKHPITMRGGAHTAPPPPRLACMPLSLAESTSQPSVSSCIPREPTPHTGAASKAHQGAATSAGDLQVLRGGPQRGGPQLRRHTQHPAVARGQGGEERVMVVVGWLDQQRVCVWRGGQVCGVADSEAQQSA